MVPSSLQNSFPQFSPHPCLPAAVSFLARRASSAALAPLPNGERTCQLRRKFRLRGLPPTGSGSAALPAPLDETGSAALDSPATAPFATGWRTLVTGAGLSCRLAAGHTGPVQGCTDGLSGSWRHQGHEVYKHVSSQQPAVIHRMMESTMMMVTMPATVMRMI